MKSIPQNSSVYVDNFDFPEIRRGLILRLSHTNLLYGPAYLQAALQNPTIKYLFLNPTNVTEQVIVAFIFKDKVREVELWEMKN